MIKPQLILASSSSGRKKLLEKLGVSFEIIPSTINEDSITDSNPIVMIQKRSKAKVNDVVKKILSKPFPLNPNPYLILAADSSAILGNRIFGKPRDSQDAFSTIKSLSGTTHTFATAIVIEEIAAGQNKRIHEAIQETKITMRQATDEEIKKYVNTYLPAGRQGDLTSYAGAYSLDETPWDFVTKIEGSLTNVIGLPFEVMLPVLKKYQLM